MLSVRTFKYDGTEHRRWVAKLLKTDGSLLILDAKFPERIDHPLLGTIAADTVSIEYYWLDRWYNVFRFNEPSGELRNFYCNINVPPVLIGNVLSYIDLDIDILVAPDLSYRILDEDEFLANATRFSYPRSIIRQAEGAMEELVTMIQSHTFPFSDLK